MYASIRTYRMGSGSLDILMHRVDRDFAEALAQEPGFVAYQAVDLGGGKIATTTVFRERAQADASNDLAAEWVASELSEFAVERMGVIGGEILVSRAIADVIEPAHH